MAEVLCRTGSLHFMVVVFSIMRVPVSAVNLIDPPGIVAKECYGTYVGLGTSGGSKFHYESLQRRYKGCTYVYGNLEITNLYETNGETYDLSFLQNIRVITGYVLLGLINVAVIPLTSLELIRADYTYKIKGEQYGLIVALTSTTFKNGSLAAGLQELQLPALREISHGKVLFSENRLLCHVNTILWNVIVPREQTPVHFDNYAFSKSCSNCDPACKVGGTGYCWGPQRSMCQRVFTSHCHSFCMGRCYNKHILGCCHPQCAVGCWGPRDNDCMMCKYFRYGSSCVSQCPPDTYPTGQQCI